MGEKPASAPARTPAKTPSSTGKQQSILGFFSKASQPKAKTNTSGTTSSASATPSTSKADKSTCLKETTKANSLSFAKRPSNITPVPSSDAAEPLSSQENVDVMTIDSKVPSDSLPSPKSPAELDHQPAPTSTAVSSSSPSRKVQLYAWLSPTIDCRLTMLLPGQEDRQLRRAI